MRFLIKSSSKANLKLSLCGQCYPLIHENNQAEFDKDTNQSQILFGSNGGDRR